VIAAQSVNFVERFIIDEGHTAQRVEADYGYDLYVTTFDEEGYAEPGLIYFQLKATDDPELTGSGTDYVLDVAVEDYHAWIDETMPVILVLFDARKRRAWWLYFQRYCFEDPTRAPRKGAKTFRVFIPNVQKFSRRAVAAMRTWKRRVLEQSWGRIDHA
jgi:hypothetical protein